MAENLGTAVLRLEVDDTALREGLAQARRLIEGTSAELGRQTRSGGRAQRASAPGARLGGAREAADADIKARQRIIGVQNRINLLEAKGVDISQARARLSQAIVAEEQRNFGTVRRVTSQLSNTLKVEEGRLRVSAAQAAQLKRQEAAAKAVASAERGPRQRPTGVGFATTPEQILAGRGGTQRGAAEGLKAREAAADKLVQLRNRINILDAKGVQLGTQKATLENILQAANAGRLGTSKQLIQSLSRQLSIEENNLRVSKLREAADKRRASEAAKAARGSQPSQVSPSGGLVVRPNPASVNAERQLARERLRTADATLKALANERRAAQQRSKEIRKRAGGAISSGLIGGGFPLLFGQGPGAAVGGAFGGVAGGALGGGFGFALSIVGTAVGQAFDEALNKGKTLAAGLEDPIGKFEELRQAGLISSKAVEKSVSSLIAQGREAEAAAKIQLDLSTAFGDTSGLDDLNNAYDELNRSFSQLSVITAKFVAGPLSDFLNKLASSFQVFSARSLFEERLKGASPEVQAEARRRVKQRAAEFSGSGRSLSDVGTEAFSAGLTFLDERLGKTKQVQQAEAAIALAAARQNDLRSLSFRQIEAQVKGYQRLGLELEQQRIEQQRLQDLSVPNADADAINRKAAQDKFTVEQQLNQLTQDRIATQSLEGAQNRLALESVQERISAARQLGSLEEGVARSTLETALNIKASVAEAKRREQEIGAQIDAARIRGGDAGEAEASRLVGEQRVAAEETKLKLIEGATALRDAGVRLRKDLDSAFLNLQKLRTGSGGLNQFLGGQDRARREEDVFQALLPRLRQAQGTFARLTGVRAPEFSGPTSSVNQTILQFIDAVKAEEQALTNTVDTQRALSDNTAALASITGELRTVMGQLTEKNWAVNVSVAADGSSQAYGDVLNGALAS